jgi:hypothetical protein
MNIEYFQSLLIKHEDAVVHFKKRAPVLATLNFETPYVRQRVKGIPQVKEDKVPVWSWTNNKLIYIDTNEVKFVEPLHTILGNKL